MSQSDDLQPTGAEPEPVGSQSGDTLPDPSPASDFTDSFQTVETPAADTDAVSMEPTESMTPSAEPEAAEPAALAVQESAATPAETPREQSPVLQFFERRRVYGRRWTDNIRRLAIVCMGVAGVLLVIAVMRYLSLVLVPFALAFVLAYVLNPVAEAATRGFKKRGPAVGVTVLAISVVFTLLAWQLAPLIGAQVKDFIDDLSRTWINVQRSVALERLNRTYMPDTLTEAVMDRREETASRLRSEVGLQEFLAAWGQYVKNPDADQSVAIGEMRSSMATSSYLRSLFDNTIVFIQNRPLEGMINNAVQGVLVSGVQALMTLGIVLALVGVFIVAMVYLVLLLVGFPEHSRIWKSFLPVHLQGYLMAVGAEFKLAMDMYFIRQLIAALITVVIFCLGFTYAQLPLAVPYGIFCGMLSMVPYLQLAGIAPAIVLAAFHALEARTPFTPLLLGVLLTFVVVQLAQELLLKPFLVGRGRGFERMGILLGAFIWPLLLKPALGFVLAIPLTCVLIALYRVKAKQLEIALEEDAAAALEENAADVNAVMASA